MIPLRQRSADRVYLRKPGGGRKPMTPRQIFSAIVYVAHRLPMEGSSLRVWQIQCGTSALSEVAAGRLLPSFWQAGLAEYDEMEAIAWNWQSIDGAMYKAPLATECVGPNPTDLGKNGRKRSLLIDGIGVPPSLIVSGANRHDVKLLEATLDQIVMEMPGRVGQYNLCADAGYKGAPALNAAVERDSKPHIKQRREEAHEKLTTSGFKARRWVVERAHSWINRFRKLLVSFEKTEASYVALLSRACAMICCRKTVTING